MTAAAEMSPRCPRPPHPPCFYYSGWEVEDLWFEERKLKPVTIITGLEEHPSNSKRRTGGQSRPLCLGRYKVAACYLLWRCRAVGQEIRSPRFPVLEAPCSVPIPSSFPGATASAQAGFWRQFLKIIKEFHLKRCHWLLARSI